MFASKMINTRNQHTDLCSGFLGSGYKNSNTVLFHLQSFISSSCPEISHDVLDSYHLVKKFRRRKKKCLLKEK